MKTTKHTSPGNSTLVNWFFDDVFLRDSFEGSLNKSIKSNTPKTNIVETSTEFRLELSAPGFTKENFILNVTDKRITITGKIESSSSELNYRMKEFRCNPFERVFKLPENINLKDINAEYTNGILHIALPKKLVERKSLEIKVK